MDVRECCRIELSLNKKSIFGFNMKSLILFLLTVCFLAGANAADTEISCTNVKNMFEKKGMSAMVDIQPQPNSDADQLCLNHGCCGPNSRQRLTQQARSQLEAALRSELSKLSDMLLNRANKFDEFFRKLLKLSREEFHAMFKRTYGMIYEQHSYVFEQLFEQLERYYSRGDTNFDAMMDSFFGILYKKMFTVLNSQYTFDEKYLKCVNEHMREIQPFEDVPKKLSVQLRRAVVATRTFHKALRAGADVVRDMTQAGLTPECATAWTRLRYCGACGGLQVPACSRYCHNVIRGCLPAHADLGEQWDAYVDAVDKVADRLLGPFNIAMVVEPIDIKISEAIMSFQEHNREISQRIFTGCGKPVLGGGGGAGPFFASDRARRSPRAIPDFDWNQKANDVDDFEVETTFESLINDDPQLVGLRTPEGIKKATAEMAEQAKLRDRFLQYMRGNIGLEEYEEHERKKRDADPDPAPAGGLDIDFRNYDFDKKSKKKKPAAKSEDSHGSDWGGPALERLVRETRTRVRNTRRYWHHLPALMCSSTSTPSAPCFNSSAVASYTLIAAGDGTIGLASNPEVKGKVSPTAETVVAAEIETLKTLTARLKDAFNGVEVQWTDAEDREMQPASSSAQEYIDGAESGSGSGDFGNDDDLTDDDDEGEDDYERGSGDSAEEETVEPPTDVEPPMNPPPPLSTTTTTIEPYIPVIVDSPATNNVFVRPRLDDTPRASDIDIPPDTSSDRTEVQDTSAREQPVTDAADRPSLQKALFTYALPVVCAWFGTIITDLF